MSISPREELLQIQKQLYQRNQELIEDSILVNEPQFDRYERAYRKAVARYRRLSSPKEMLKAIEASDIIYVGDYHTLHQSQRSFLRILKEVVTFDRKPMIALELLHARHQPVLNRFLAGKISEQTFLKGVRLQEHWVFDLWENFKPLFDFFRYHRLTVFAADAAPLGSTLQERDRATAQILAEALESFPEQRLFVFIGDLHVAPLHLPQEVERLLKKRRLKRQHLILYQNSVPIYWKLAEQKLEDQVEVVQIDAKSFCRMHTPPVICQRSYLNWLEHEEGEIDYADARHDFLDLADRIGKFLRIRPKKSDLESVEVFTAGDLSFLKKLKQTKSFSAEELEIVKQQILSSESYYIAKARFVYLANMSVNHAAEEAAHFLKHICTGDEEPRDLVDAFYANILHEALGFLGSKVINHKRKCHRPHDFRNLVSYFRSNEISPERQGEYEAAVMILEYLKHEKRGDPLQYADIFKVRIDLFLWVTHALGYMLGERLYYGVMEEILLRQTVRELFFEGWHDEGEPLEAYLQLKLKLKKVRLPRRV